MARPRKDIQKPLPKSLKTRVRLKSVPKNQDQRRSLLDLDDITPKKEAEEKNSSLQVHVENTLILMEEHLNKLGILLDHYNINKNDENCWLFLSLALARDYIEGFKTTFDKPAGRKEEWTDNELIRLYFDVRLKSLNAPKYIKSSVNWAYKEIAKEKEKEARRSKKNQNETKTYSSKTLQNLFIKSKKLPDIKIINIFESMSKKPFSEEMLKLAASIFIKSKK